MLTCAVVPKGWPVRCVNGEATADPKGFQMPVGLPPDGLSKTLIGIIGISGGVICLSWGTLEDALSLLAGSPENSVVAVEELELEFASSRMFSADRTVSANAV